MTDVFAAVPESRTVPVAMTPAAAQPGPESNGSGPGLDFSVFLGIGASLGTLVDGMQSDRDRKSCEQPPGNEPIFASGIVPASGTLILDLGSCPQGRVWQIRRLVVGGVKVTTTAAGKAYAFAQGAPPSDLVLTDCVEMFSALPALNKYGTHQLFLLGGDHLWVALVGATATQQYNAAARVEDWDDATFRSTFTE